MIWREKLDDIRTEVVLTHEYTLVMIALTKYIVR